MNKATIKRTSLACSVGSLLTSPTSSSCIASLRRREQHLGRCTSPNHGHRHSQHFHPSHYCLFFLHISTFRLCKWPARIEEMGPPFLGRGASRSWVLMRASSQVRHEKNSLRQLLHYCLRGASQIGRQGLHIGTTANVDYPRIVTRALRAEQSTVTLFPLVLVVQFTPENISEKSVPILLTLKAYCKCSAWS